MSTGGEGGMLVTNDPILRERMWSFKDHGKNPQLVKGTHPVGQFRWVHDSIGTNLRITEMQSAIGRVLIRKLPQSVEARRQRAKWLNKEFRAIPGLRLTCPGADVYHSYYKYYVFLRPEALNADWTRGRIIEAIQAEGIPCFTGGCSEIYLEKAFAENAARNSRLPVARELGETSLMFLVHPTVTEQDLADTCAAVSKVMNRATLKTLEPSGIGSYSESAVA